MEPVKLYDGPLPPLAVLLLHVGACSEALTWAGRRPITAAALSECPNGEWLEWIAKTCRTAINAPWVDWERAVRRALSGSGSGYGYGYGNGDGNGYGYGRDIVSA